MRGRYSQMFSILEKKRTAAASVPEERKEGTEKEISFREHLHRGREGSCNSTCPSVQGNERKEQFAFYRGERKKGTGFAQRKGWITSPAGSDLKKEP